MVRVIMHGCNGVMGQVITGMAKDMEGLTIVAGIDLKNDKENGYPVYASLEECKEEADAVVDFASPKAADHLMDFCAEKKLGLVLCTTGLSEEQIKKVKETAEKPVQAGVPLYTRFDGFLTKTIREKELSTHESIYG